MSERVAALGGRLAFAPATAAGRGAPGQGLGRPGLRVTATVPDAPVLAVPPAHR